jgi:hypothetical protein
MALAIVLYGPKGVGKSWVAQTPSYHMVSITSMSTRWSQQLVVLT